MSDNEKTSAAVASLAAKALRDPLSLSPEEIRSLAASCLTQAPDEGVPVTRDMGEGQAGTFGEET